MAPLARALRKSILFEIKILSTGQHRELLKQVLPIFDLQIDYDLDIMIPNQTPSYVLSQILKSFNDITTEFCPDLVLVHGDTTTALGAGLASFHSKIPVAHIEAGLRSGNKQSPFPEEINRLLLSKVSTYHFAPTITSQDNLIKEGIEPSTIFVTGNTIIDALYFVKTMKKQSSSGQNGTNAKKIITITIHRRENLGVNLRKICTALRVIASRNQNIDFVFPVHPNPNLRQSILEHLSCVPNVKLVNPINYVDFINLLTCSFLILTDSSGIQEEAPSLGKPVLLLRENTERTESNSNVKIIGVEMENIIDEVESILLDETARKKMSAINHSYGDGNASDRITSILENIFFPSMASYPKLEAANILTP